MEWAIGEPNERNLGGNVGNQGGNAENRDGMQGIELKQKKRNEILFFDFAEIEKKKKNEIRIFRNR